MVPADSRRIPRDPRYSGLRWGWRSFVYRTITVYGGTFQTLPLQTLLPDRVPTTPDMPKHARFGLFPVRSPLLGESLLFSLPAGTKMFQFPAFASPSNIMVITTSGGWVVPFGDRGIKGYLRLPHAFRSLSRPSSPPGAKASALRPLLLSVSCDHSPDQGTGSCARGLIGTRPLLVLFFISCDSFDLL